MSYTVIIPAHNRPDLLARALRGVRLQIAPADEIIVVDDGSQPPLALPPSHRNARTRILRNEQPCGAAAARNRGLAEARGEFVAFLDDDDEWLPNKMLEQLRYFAEHPDCVMVSCGSKRIQAGVAYSEVFSEETVRHLGLYDSFIGSFSFIAIRRPSSGLWPLLDPLLPAFQDWEYFLRIRETGDVGMVERPLARYYAHASARITTAGGRRFRGLRRTFFRHRAKFPRDARRWVLSRLIFERAQGSRRWRRKARWIALSLRAGAGCALPVRVKWRALFKRFLSLAIDVAVLEAFRARIFSMPGLRRNGAAV